MHKIQATTFDEMYLKAKESCNGRICTNFILHGILDYGEIHSKIILPHKEIAKEWQDSVRPKELHINHGEYIHKCGNGEEYIIEELGRKKDSNRAVISLINMKDIIGSEDKPIPSFMVLQLGLDSDYKKLLITAYFRALEVTKFLLINLAEIAHFVEIAKKKFVDIDSFELTLHAFKAYSRPQFNCLRKSEIDTVRPIPMAKLVSEKKIDQMQIWLNSKLVDITSVVDTGGLENLIECVKKWKHIYNSKLIEHLEESLYFMQELKNLRKVSSHAERLSELERKISSCLEEAIEVLQKESENGT